MSKKSYLKSVGTLIGGSTLAQLVNIGSYPIIARTYSPENFGAYALFITVTAIAGSVCCLRFEMIIPSASSDNQLSVFAASQIANATISVLLLIVMVALSQSGAVDYGVYVSCLAALVIALTGLTNASAILLLQSERYAVRTSSIVVRSVVTVLVQIVAGVLGDKDNGLINGFCVGFVAQAMLLLHAVVRARLPDSRIEMAAIRSIFRKYRHIVLFDIPSTLVSALSINAMSILISVGYSVRELGLYSISFRIAALPLSIIAAGLSEVYFQKASTSRRNSGVFLWEFRFTLATSLALSAAFVISYVLLGGLITRILGEEWSQADGIIILLVPLLASRLVAISIQTTALVIGKSRWLLINNIAVLSAMLVAISCAITMDMKFSGYLLLNSSLCALIYVLFVVFLYRKVRAYHIAL